MTLAFRDAIATDLGAIVTFLADDLKGRAREEEGDPGYLAAFDAISADPNQRLIVVTQSDAIVGTMQLSFLAGLSFRGAWRLQIEAVRVVSHLRGQGIGAAMIEWAVAQARDRGCRMVQLTTHRDRVDAHRFYDRLGFSQSHLGYKLTL